MYNTFELHQKQGILRYNLLFLIGGMDNMKYQWTILVALLFAVLIAIFAVFNVDSVPVNFIFSTEMIPLVLIILGSALLGALVSGLFAIYKSYSSGRRVKDLQKQFIKCMPPQQVFYLLWRFFCLQFSAAGFCYERQSTLNSVNIHCSNYSTPFPFSLNQD